MTWILVVVRLAGEPSRNRVAVWRELRRAGAVPVAQAVWVVPSTPAFLAAVERAAELARRGEGDVLVLEVASRDAAGESALRDLFAAARVQEWAEFVDDCGKFEVEIAKEIRVEKFTLAELEEEEQSLERLRRWYRDLKARDVLDLPAAVESEARLRVCAAALEGYADLVFRYLHGNPVGRDSTSGAEVGDG
ncbi:Chromate resistance protein ChrB [Pengzhenrongella frigida]|uniref:Chromate resistance protein ChrB n=1 Tax=Pengzhenrongella frigida TaxID=1259133 RepID=A0A4Q5MV11_9MICO|nr:Chromate resistance protein ChrB [Cellulomonas sp. HLT2-17]RYV49406.1 chromate resistance protein ChrB [Cellulomonas sp. HLT2-17]